MSEKNLRETMFCLLPLEMCPPLLPLQANIGITSTCKTGRRKSKRERKEIIVIMPELADSGHLEANANGSKKDGLLNLFVFP
jgi:hypothetical protein